MIYKWIKALFSRVVIISALILIQIGFLVFAVWKLSGYFVYWYISCVLLSLLVIVSGLLLTITTSYPASFNAQTQ